jgi:hypothetical protein
MALLTLHLKLLRGFLLTHFHLMIGTGSHASTDTAEHNIGNKVDASHYGIVTFKVNADIEA